MTLKRCALAGLSGLALLSIAGCGDDGTDEVKVDTGTIRVVSTDTVNRTVYIAIGLGSPTSYTVTASATTNRTVAVGTYTVTVDDDGTAGISGGDTVYSSQAVTKDTVTTINYTGPAPIPPAPAGAG